MRTCAHAHPAHDTKSARATLSQALDVEEAHELVELYNALGPKDPKDPKDIAGTFFLINIMGRTSILQNHFGSSSSGLLAPSLVHIALNFAA